RRLDAGQVREQQRFAGAAWEIPARDDAGQGAAAGGVDGTSFFRQLCLVEDAEDDALGVECYQSLGPDIKLHSLFSLGRPASGARGAAVQDAPTLRRRPV